MGSVRDIGVSTIKGKVKNSVKVVDKEGWVGGVNLRRDVI